MHDIPERFGRSDSLARVEDQDLLLGKGQFVDDLHRSDELHLVFLRSPYAHAKIRAIDCTAAKASEGVVAVITGADLASLGVNPMPAQAAFKRADGSLAPVAPRPILATDTVRFVGEPLAAVIAQTKSQALLASESIVVDFDPLEVCADMPDDVFEASLSAEPLPRGPVAETRFGDAAATEAAFQKSAHVVQLRLDHRRLAAVTIEPRTSRAYPEGDRLIIELSSQMPTLKILLPITLPTMRSVAPRQAASIETATSEALVPKETTVRPITKGESPSQSASPLAPRTSSSEPTMSAASPSKNKKRSDTEDPSAR